MGREVRRVPPNWQHPKPDRPTRSDEYQPMFDQSVEAKWAEWQAEYQAWLSGEFERVRTEHPEYKYDPREPYRAFCAWHGNPPDPDYYRPAWDEATATWYQIYETVTEGTPVTPPFEFPEQLVDYLVNNGDFWDQKRRSGGWPRESATRFVTAGWAPSGAVVVTNGKPGPIMAPRDGIV